MLPDFFTVVSSVAGKAVKVKSAVAAYTLVMIVAIAACCVLKASNVLMVIAVGLVLLPVVWLIRPHHGQQHAHAKDGKRRRRRKR